MGRKKAPISEVNVAEKQASALAQTLNALITDPNALKNHLGCSIQAINQYKLGISRPTLDNLCKIADFYGVSTDYLLGRTQVKSTDATLQAAAEYTGLSESSIMWLHRKSAGPLEVIDRLFECEGFKKALPLISLMRTRLNIDNDPAMDQERELSLEELDELDNIECRLLDFRFSIISNSAYFEWQRHKIAKFLEDSIEEIIPISKMGGNNGQH